MLTEESAAWQSLWERAEFGVKFLMDGRHYSDAEEKASLSSEDIRWVHEDAFNRLRHELGVVVKPGLLTAMPLDQDGNMELGDLACKAILSDTDQPEKEWEDAWYDTAMCGSAGGYGVNWLDYVPDGQGGGDLLLLADDPRNFMCDRRVKSVHNPLCRFVVRRVRMTIGEAMQRCEGRHGWNKDVCKNLQPDDGNFSTWRPGETPELETSQAARLVQDQDGTDEERMAKECTFFFIWRRRSDDREVAPDDYVEFEPEDRYMRCTACGYRTEAQGSLPANDDGSPQELPAELENGCPECMQSSDVAHHGNMVRVDGMDLNREMLKYPKGYLCIVAPMALPGVEDFVYEGGWPAKLRSYPCTFLPRFRHPFRVSGPSIADLTAWNTIATDMLMRTVLERMVAIEPAQVLPLDAFFDARGNPWESSSERGLGAFYIGQQMPQTGLISGDPGVPASWSAVYQAARQALTSAQGIADFSIQEGQTRDIAAQSAALQIRQEEIPAADYRRRYENLRSIMSGIYYDYKRAVDPSDALYRAGDDDGDQFVRNLALADLPNFSFRFSSDPDMKPQDAESARATSELIAAIEQRPWAVDLIAQRNHISPALVRKARQDFARQQQQNQAAAAQAAAQAQGAGAGMGPGPAPPQRESPQAMVDRLLAGAGQQQA
jgi:hypothetical protein